MELTQGPGRGYVQLLRRRGWPIAIKLSRVFYTVLQIVFQFFARLCVLAVCLPLAAVAQDGEKGDGEPSPGVAGENVGGAQPQPESIDEVTVMGARSLANLRFEIERAEDNIYAIFNSLNDDDRYDVICKKETRIGSHIPHRVCLARLFRDAMSEDAEDDVLVGIHSRKMPGAEKHMKKLKEKMLALAAKHPELLAALNERHKLSKKFEHERAKKYD